MEEKDKKKLDQMAKKLVRLTPQAEIKKLQSNVKSLKERVFTLEEAFIQILSKQPEPPEKKR